MLNLEFSKEYMFNDFFWVEMINFWRIFLRKGISGEDLEISRVMFRLFM